MERCLNTPHSRHTPRGRGLNLLRCPCKHHRVCGRQGKEGRKLSLSASNPSVRMMRIDASAHFTFDMPSNSTVFSYLGQRRHNHFTKSSRMTREARCACHHTTTLPMRSKGYAKAPSQATHTKKKKSDSRFSVKLEGLAYISIPLGRKM